MSNRTLIFELSSPGRIGFSLPEVDMDEAPVLDPKLMRENLDLPEVSEIDVMRHFVRLSQKNYSIDTDFYPLGSCTMKYNPKVHEDVAIMPGFAHIHPYQPEETSAGRAASSVRATGYACADYQAWTRDAAARGRRAGRVHGHPDDPRVSQSRGDNDRDVILVPDSAHGTNPATAAAAGFKMDRSSQARTAVWTSPRSKLTCQREGRRA